MKFILDELRAALALTAVMVVLLCGAYPLAVWGVAQIAFHEKANGSLIIDDDGVVRGSALLGQNFSGAGYFHPRPSAAGSGYDGAGSFGTNLGPTSAILLHGVHPAPAAGGDGADAASFAGIADLVRAYRSENGLAPGQPVPADAVTRSASGLDRHISVANAALQAARVARVRGIALARIRSLIAANTEGPDFGLFGDPGVNVLLLNRALDREGAHP